MKIIRWLVGIVAVLVVVLLIAIRLLNYYPPDIEHEPVACAADAPTLATHQQLKIMTWNVQFMAGKGYVFFFDVAGDKGPDSRPSSQAITTTLAEVARVTKAENPDIVLLQEVDKGAKRTDYRDELAELRALLPDDYKCQTQAYYYKSAFVPHPKILGSMALTLSIVSKYRINDAIRYQLPLPKRDWLTRQFYFRPAILVAHLPKQDGSEFVALDTHLDAFDESAPTKQLQLEKLKSILDQLSQEHKEWTVTGDFNILMPGIAYNLLQPSERHYFNPHTEITILTDHYASVPSVAETNSNDYRRWFTHLPNDPSVGKIDRTIDYIFYSPLLHLTNHAVRQFDTQKISDHFPVTAEFGL